MYPIRPCHFLQAPHPLCFHQGQDLPRHHHSISGLQDVSWIARWDRGVTIQLVLNLLNLDRWASSSWCWCWFSSWFCSCVPRGPSRRVFFGRCRFCTLLLCC